MKGVPDRLAVGAAALAAAAAATLAATGAVVPVTVLLERVRALGVQVVYSSDLVHPGVTVPDPGPPRDREDLERVRNALAQAGLELRPVGPEAFIVVRHEAAGAACRLRLRVFAVQAGGEPDTGNPDTSGQRAPRPVAGALVALTGPAHADARTGADGTADSGAVPCGEYHVTVSAPPHAAAHRTLTLSPGAPPLPVLLDPPAGPVEQVVVTADRVRPGTRGEPADGRFQLHDLATSPLRTGDALDALERIPGVAAGQPGAPPRIRGAGGRDTMVVLDGLELYEPYHLPASQEPLSMLDPASLGTLEVQTGGMSARYGDRLGGVVRAETTAPAADSALEITAGTALSRVAVQGRVSGRTRFTASAREWYPNALASTVNIGDVAIRPRLVDVTGKLFGRVGESSAASVHVLLAQDDVDYTSADGQDRVRAASRTAYAWGRLVADLGGGFAGESVAGFGSVRHDRDGLSADPDAVTAVRDARRLEILSLLQSVSHAAGRTGVVEAGLELHRVRAQYDYDATLERAAPEAVSRTVDASPSGTSSAAYAEYRVRPARSVDLSLGLRWSRQTYAPGQQWSPRVQLTLTAPRGTLCVNAGRYHQSQRIHELDVADGESTFAPAEYSEEVGAAWDGWLGRGWHYRVAAFRREFRDPRPSYENLFDPIDVFPEIRRDRVRVDPERARAEGAEFGVESPAHASLQARAAYTWSRAEDRIDGRRVPRTGDARHSATGTIAWRFRRGATLALAGVARTGVPATPAEAVLPGEAPGDPPTLSEGARNSLRLPGYFRLDARLTLDLLPGGALRLDLALINLTNRRNAVGLDVEFDGSAEPAGGHVVSGAGFAPVVSATLRF